MFNSGKYWEDRYKQGGNSGDGSYNDYAEYKSEVINSIIEEYSIKSINEYGHGDGNQLKYFKGFSTYTGFDISPTVRVKCQNIYKDSKNIKFIDSTNNFTTCDLVLSIDVIYHLVEQEVFEKHIKDLFSTNSKYVLIYTIDADKGSSQHVKARKTTSYIKDNIKNYTLLKTIPGFHNQTQYDSQDLVFLLYTII